MKKIIFDASIFLGQFNITSENIRLVCKDFYDSVSLKGEDKITAVCTFNENSWVDHVVWSLSKEEQDCFYRFMDTFHSLKNIIRVPLLLEDAQKAIELSKQFNLEFSCALSCSVAIREQAQEIYTLYRPFLNNNKLHRYLNKIGIIVKIPDSDEKQSGDSDLLEKLYQETFQLFKKKNLDIMKMADKCGINQK